MKRLKTQPPKPFAMTIIYLISTILILAVLAGSLSGCATVVKTNYSPSSNKQATVYYYLPESLIKIHVTTKVAVIYDENKALTGSSRVIEQTFSATTEQVADTRNLLSLNYISNSWATDDIKYNVNSKGLLETVEVTTEDRTAQIITQLAEASKVILTGGITQPKGDGLVKIKDFTADFVIKAADLKTTDTKISWNIIIQNEFMDEVKTLPADFEVLTPTPIAMSAVDNSTTGGSKNEIKGILTRPLKSFALIIKGVTNRLGTTLPIYISIPDQSKLIIVPITRSAFVKKVNKISIVDGIITSNAISKPSSIEGLASIPIDIAKAVVSIPAQLLSVKIDNTKNATELQVEKLKLEQSTLANQTYILGKGRELEKAKIESEKSLLTAEKEKLAVQKELETTKAELDALKKKINN